MASLKISNLPAMSENQLMITFIEEGYDVVFAKVVTDPSQEGDFVGYLKFKTREEAERCLD